jgi:beta-lactamase superfamily II metal-dependent hydrolase
MKKYMKYVISVLVLLLLMVSPVFSETMEIYFLDVGQGDAALITAPTSGKTILIDSGPCEDTILNYLNDLGVNHIDLIVASHAHTDHITGMGKVIDLYKPTAYIDPGVPHTTKTYETLLESVKRNNITYYHAAERKIKLGDITLSLLPPGNFSDLNNDSAVVRLDFKNFSCLFTGDIEAERERELIHTSEDKLDVDILKIPHHGSSTGTTASFLKATKPELAIIFSGKDNRYGHPHEETLSALQTEGITVYRTDLNGTILVETDGNKHTITVEKNDPRGPPTATAKHNKSLQSAQGKPQECNYVASRKSKVFHYAGCNSASKIRPENRICFSAREEAVKSGRRPCKVCKP